MAEKKNPWAFVQDDRLPTINECVLSIIEVAPTHGTTKQKDIMHDMAVWLRALWVKSFGEENIMVRNSITKQLTKYLKSYETLVRKSKRSKRKAIKKWRSEENTMVLFNLKKKEVDPETFPEKERLYYYDQLALTRKWILSSEVDVDYEKKKELEKEERAFEDLSAREEMEYIMQVDEEDINIINRDPLDNDWLEYDNPNVSLNRSGKARLVRSLVDASTQTDGEYVLKTVEVVKKPLRKGTRNFDESLTIGLASSCAVANISPEQSRKAFQTTSASFFGMQYYLSPEEVPSTNTDNVEPSASKKPRTSNDYQQRYADVIASAKTIGRVKHLMALQEERNAALAILDTTPEDVLTIHYDTTTRKRLNGEWPSLIVKMSNGKKFRLRSLNMALEDRKNIVKLFVVTLNRLSITVNTDKKLLWEKVTALMTDSVSKNLGIENLIAATLYSTHIPLHLLCVSHTCEAFDSGNLQILKEIELCLELKDKVLSYLPSLRSFLSSGIAHAAIVAFGKLVTNDGHKSSLYEEFDAELEAKGKPKKFSIFQERRFALLGYTAAAIIHHHDDISATLTYTNSQNQLVQACRMYSQMDYIKIALSSVAWFTYKVTFPFLNMCEIVTTTKLLEVLPKLKTDLESGKLDTLNDYKVNYSFEVVEPKGPLGKMIISRFCTRAADDLTRQRGREYGFSLEPQRSTDLVQVPVDVCDKIPTNNLDCERDLSIMDKLATRSAACSNKKFTGKSMRDDMALYQANVKSIDKETKRIAKFLDKDEQEWFNDQKELIKEKIAKRKEKAIHQGNYVHNLLAKCKLHGGPFITPAELDECLSRGHEEKELKRILRNEILFRRHTSIKDYHDNPSMYKVNVMSVTDMKVNLAILLGNNHASDLKDDEVTMPDEQDMMKKLIETNGVDSSNSFSLNEPMIQSNPDDPDVVIGEPCIIVWDMPKGRDWFVGMVRSSCPSGYIVDHLEKAPRNRDQEKMYWRYPKCPDEQEVELDQIIPCNVIGAWDQTKKRRHTFELSNWDIIEGIFRSMYGI